MTASLKKAIFAGFAGTVAMTAFSFLSGHLHLPAADFRALLSAHLPFPGFFSWIAYFAVGIALAYFYGTYIRAMLPAHSWTRGVIYALILWAATGIVLMPLFGMGFFTGSLIGAISTFAAMAFYGAAVGYVYDAE